MTVRQVQCFIPECDTCDEPWDGHDYIPHCETAEKAIAYARSHGWLIVGTSMRCRECAAEADCTATGHQFDEWEDVEIPDVLPHRMRRCDHCGEIEHDPPFGQLMLFRNAERQLADRDIELPGPEQK